MKRKIKEPDDYGMKFLFALIGVVSNVINHQACVDTQASMACSDLHGARY